MKAILSDYDTKEFIAPDAWCDFYTDGTYWQPYYIFASDAADNKFGANESHSIGLQVKLPVGATGKATITVDASWPNPQEEPWRINNVIVSGPLQNDFAHYIGFTAHVYAHQNVSEVVGRLGALEPTSVVMGDDGAHRDYLKGDGIYGATDVKTTAAAGLYTGWIKAGGGSSHYTYQQIDIDVIPPATTVTPLYIVSMMPADELSGYLDQTTFLGYSAKLRKLEAIFNLHKAKIALQPDWSFITGEKEFDSTLFTDFQADGHGVDTRASETSHDLGEVHDLLDSTGITDTIVENGGFDKTWDTPPGGNWAAYVAHFQTTGGQQMFFVSDGYRDPASGAVDALFTPIRPSLTGDWMVDDPSGPIVYISGGAVGLDGNNSISSRTCRIRSIMQSTGSFPVK